jgi:cytidylate kinase
VRLLAKKRIRPAINRTNSSGIEERELRQVHGADLDVRGHVHRIFDRGAAIRTQHLEPGSVRVQRRIKELRDKDESVNEQRVWDDMVARDARDSGRSVAPLKPADDAFVLDTSSMNADEAFAQAKAFIVSKKKT